MTNFPSNDSSSGVFSREDLGVMRRVFDAVCAREALDPVTVARDSVDKRSAIASGIVAHYFRGARDEAALIELMMTRRPVSA